MRRAAVAFALSWCAEATARAACPGAGEQVVAYSVAADRYAIRVDAPTPLARRFVVKSLSTGEPLDEVACAGDQQCDLIDVLGMRACGFTNVHTSKANLDLSLQKEAEGSDSWSLMLARAGGTLPVLTLRAHGTLELGAARLVGGKVLLVVRETSAGACPEVRARVLEIDAAVLHASQARVATPGFVDVDLTVVSDFDAPALRVAPIFPTMPARLSLNAAQAAIAAGMPALAECWLRHAATVMSEEDRQSMRRVLADHPNIAALLHLAQRRTPFGPAPREPRSKARAARRGDPTVTVVVSAPHPITPR